MPKVSKVKSQATHDALPEESEVKQEMVIHDDDPKRTELVSRLNDAVSKWKEQKGIPKEEKDNAISKVLKKLKKKDKKDKKAFDEAKKFLKKISNFDPKEVESINLDKLKKKKHEEKIKHHKNVKGNKLKVEIKDKPKINKKKGCSVRRQKKVERKEIMKAIKEQQAIDIKQNHKSLLVSEEKLKEHEKPRKRKIKAEPKKLKIKLPQIKLDKIKSSVKIEKIKSVVKIKAGNLQKGLKQTFNSLKKQIKNKTAHDKEEYPSKFIKEQEGFKERSIFLREKHKDKINHIKKQIQQKTKHEELDAEIEKIYKEIIEL